jgi:hypothetical protein
MAKKNRQAKEMELDMTEEVMEAAPQEEKAIEEEPRKRAEAPKVHFDGWYAARAAAIPVIHKKEIIKADFKGRKVPMMATMKEFDEALKMYGVKLA